MQTRLDIYLYEQKMVKSRSAAAEMIKSGSISVNGSVITKPSFTVNDGDSVFITGEVLKYVGRGGLKLEKAIDFFSIDLSGRTCLDIGASTGGFTDCMLQNGAKLVYAVDVGTDQLDEKLRADSRVISMEKTDIRNVGDSIPAVDFISIDVSFISLKLVLPSAKAHLKRGGCAVALIKPQFEAGKASLNKKGIVRDEKIRNRICSEISDFAASIGFTVGNVIISPITGGDGNTEYLIYLLNEGELV